MQRLKLINMVTEYGRQLLLAAMLLFLLSPAVLGIEIPSYLIPTGIIFFFGVWIVVKHGVLSFRSILYAIIFFPALSPFFAWDIMGKGLFSLAAPELQFDKVLVDKVLYLYALAAASYAILSLRHSSTQLKNECTRHVSDRFLPNETLWFFGIMALLGAYFLESGATILTTSYADMKAESVAATPLVALLGITLGGFWSLLFVFGRNRKRLFWIITAIIFVWLFLHVRRVELFGIAFVLFLWAKYFIKPVPLILLFVGFILLQISMGYLRYVPWIDYIAGNVEITDKQFSKTELANRNNKIALPGGASNVFLSGLHLVNIKEKNILSEKDEFTMAEWIPSLVPNTIWRALGKKPFTTEHQSIYQKMNLRYVGGMPLLAVFYLNGGIWFVIIFGILHGYFAILVDKVFDRDLKPNLAHGGSLSLLVAAVFIFYQFRLQWYNPQTMFRAIVYSLIIYFLIHLYIQTIRVIKKRVK
ncbi:MAG: hypothetical protein HKP55_10375 [Gammaproteobacteria bacterium]|nr:hypothetical protein [Gammaproteobacteria bacterium]